MKKWADFYDYLLPDVPGCPLAMADLQLRQAAREFCETTLAWVEWLDDVTTVADVLEYDFDLTPLQEVIQLQRATIDDKNLPVASERDIPPDWRVSASMDRCVFTLDKKAFYVVPAQSAGLLVATQCALKPSQTAAGVEDFIHEQYAEVIASGAKARLMLSPKKPYTDGTLAAYHRGVFDSKCSEIAWQVAKSHGNAPRRTRSHYF